MAELVKLTAKRKALRIRVTASSNRSATYEQITDVMRAAERLKILEFKGELLKLDECIQNIKFSDSCEFKQEDIEREMETCIDYQEKMQDCIAMLDSLIATPSVATQQVDVARTLLKQPTAPLPSFSGKEDEDLLKFLKEFELTTSAFKYPDRDLLLLLMQQCSGNARTLLKSLEADKQTFRSAKDLLIQAFASEKKRKFSTINRFTDLNLSYNDDPYEYISKVKMLCESVTSLNIAAEDFIQFFVWNSLNKTFQAHLTQITSETIPTLAQILDNFFNVVERIQQSRKLAKSNKHLAVVQKDNSVKGNHSSSYAVSVKPKATFAQVCSLCGDKEHKSFKCPNFPESKDKHEKIKSLGGCIKCGRMNHKVDRCRIVLQSKCRHCKDWHLSSFCPRDSVRAQSMGGESKPNSVAVETNTRVAAVSYYKSGSLLPTFTCSVKGKILRGLSDRASEGSFVTEKVAKSQKLKVLQKNIKLTVCGFNRSQEYISSLVLVPVDFAGVRSDVHALVVPEIQMHLNLPDVGRVVKAFKEKGYRLADTLLKENSQEIGNIDFVLGSDFSNLLIGHDVLYGKNSVYVDSNLGTLLLGNVERVKKDLEALPPCQKVVTNNMTALPTLSASDLCYKVNIHAFLVNKFVSPVVGDESDDLNFSQLKLEQNFSVIDTHGKLQSDKLQRATDQMLESHCNQYLSQDMDCAYNDETIELHEQLVDYTLSTLTRSEEGRLVVPLLWNGKVSNHLSKNKNLSKTILKSNLSKLQREGGENLALVDQTIREQLKAGIIEKVENLDQYLSENPGHSFLPHMSIFKPERNTTKCRVVFLSNLCEKGKSRLPSLSHNQVMYSGPNLNQKLSSALLHLRFGKWLLAFDLKKAFNQLLLGDSDQSKLLFYWYKNVSKGDFSLVAYKNVRLSFGLRCSPFLLMIAMFYILVVDTENDPRELRHLKHLMYNLLYMDNGAITSDSREYIDWAYHAIAPIFSPYCFDIQQLVTNDIRLQESINKDYNENPDDVVSLFGIKWNRQTDKLYTKPIKLDGNANTKRSVLKTIASQFDIYNFNMPLLNRSRLFMHGLQCDRSLGWDTILSPDLQREWVNISKQANASPSIEVSRYVGPRDGNYKLLVFTDASHVLYGGCVYLYNEDTQALSFVSAVNRMVNNQQSKKSIPALELNAILLGVEVVLGIYQDLSSPACTLPIKVNEIILFTDSSCCLHWLNSAVNKLDKLTKLSVFVRNRLKNIQDRCEKFPIRFKFIEGERNPADAVTRCLSYRQLLKSNFLTGPNVQSLINDAQVDNVDVVIPNPKFSYCCNIKEGTEYITCLKTEVDSYPSLLNPVNFSSFLKLLSICRKLLICVQTWKAKALKRPVDIDDDVGLYVKAIQFLVQTDQSVYYPDVVEYFSGNMNVKKEIPPAVAKYNLFMDKDKIIRVKAKFRKWKYSVDKKFPILLHKDSRLTDCIIYDLHNQLAHGGCYAVLSELRKNFFLPQHFSKINKFIKNCTHCLRFNARTLKLNQGHYREFRENPPQTPFSNIFVDYLGPFFVRVHNSKEKVWLLCVTCTWSRAVNILVCKSLSLQDFLRAFQLHIYEYGVPQLFISDLGSQLSAGINVIKDIVHDVEVRQFFDFQGVKPITFQQFFKGCSQLGSLVEVCVKMIKRLIFGSIRNNVLDLSEFEFLVCYIKHLINRRPIAFKDDLRTSNLNDVPEPITPEHLIKGYEPTSLNILPELLPIPQDPEWSPNGSPSNDVRDSYFKLQKVQSNVREIYSQQFLKTLISQAVDKKDRFQPVTHKGVQVGDIVLLKEANTKPNYYPLAIVRDITLNNLGEVTGVTVFKGKTREVVKRHASTIIPLLQCNTDHLLESDEGLHPNTPKGNRPTRKAAAISIAKTKAILSD